MTETCFKNRHILFILKNYYLGIQTGALNHSTYLINFSPKVLWWNTTHIIILMQNIALPLVQLITRIKQLLKDWIKLCLGGIMLWNIWKIWRKLCHTTFVFLKNPWHNMWSARIGSVTSKLSIGGNMYE